MVETNESKRYVLKLLAAILVGATAVGAGAVLLQRKTHPATTTAITADSPDAGAPIQRRKLTRVNVMTTRLHKAHLERGIERIECDTCHVIEVDEFHRPKREVCVGCHTDRKVVAVHAEAEDGPAQDCLSCHDFLALADQPPTRWNCLRCHAKPQGKAPAIEIHANEQCALCHHPHDQPSLQPADCVQCHAAEAVRHGSRDQSPGACLDCHHPHRPAAIAATRCLACHLTNQPPVPSTARPHEALPRPERSAPVVNAVLFDGHDKCTKCHRLHNFTKQGARPCQSCHDRVRALAANAVPKHQVCTSCHNQHDVLGTPRQACQKCHADRHPDHPVDPKKGTCLGCHPPHPESTEFAAACSSCHKDAGNDRGFHLGNAKCTECHTPHEFRAAALANCKSCHSSQVKLVSLNQGHQKCTNCHTPHQPKTPPPQCGSCHEEEAGKVRAEHQVCTKCHEPHSGQRHATGCAACHSQEVRSAPSGHANCGNCHAAHSGAWPPPPRGPATASAPVAVQIARGCTDGCHADKAKTPHGRVKGGCLSCHRPHGPGAVLPSGPCNSCHRQDQLPGLHLVPPHKKCRSCHGTHGQHQATKEACLSCHTDKKDHEPKATRCTTCHEFRWAQ